MYKDRLYHLVSGLEDSELEKLTTLIAEEKTRRAEEREELRKRWVANMVREFHLRAGNYVKMDSTVVVVVNYNGAVLVGRTTPTKNDKFDLETGVAVAFAKAIGKTIPEYI